MPPAARVGDFHMCPMVTPGVPPIPHVGGPILPPGAITVLTGGMPQARATDMCLCVGPPDVIAKGSAGVFVCKLPAARMLDTCAHGGMIMIGMPTVMIGETGGGGGGGGKSSQMGQSNLKGRNADDVEKLAANDGKDDENNEAGVGKPDSSVGGSATPTATPEPQPADISYASEAQTEQAMKTAAQTGAAFVEPCYGKSPLTPEKAAPDPGPSSNDADDDVTVGDPRWQPQDTDPAPWRDGGDDGDD